MESADHTATYAQCVDDDIEHMGIFVGGGLVRGDIPYGDDLVGILWGAPNMCKGFGSLQNLHGDGSEVDDPTLAVDVAIAKLTILPLTHPRPS